jgi:hypothetical protein
MDDIIDISLVMSCTHARSGTLVPRRFLYPQWTTQGHAKPPCHPIEAGFPYQPSDGYGDYQRAYLGKATEPP